MTELTSSPRSTDPHRLSRRSLIRAAAWSAPVIAVAAPAPAMAASPPNQQFGIVFDGGGGSSGFFNSMYLNLRTIASVGAITLTAPLSLTIDVVGLNKEATDERSFTATTSHGSIERSAYNPSTFTTRLVWTVPAGESVPTDRTGSRNPDILFTFRDGASSNGRITNKVVVRSIAGGRIVEPTAPPIDSSVVRDEGGISSDGIY